jgi:hypothetical protein
MAHRGFQNLRQRLGKSIGSVQRPRNLKRSSTRRNPTSWTPCWPNTTATGWWLKTCRPPQTVSG